MLRRNELDAVRFLAVATLQANVDMSSKLSVIHSNQPRFSPKEVLLLTGDVFLVAK